MTVDFDEAVVDGDERYWVDDDAAPAVLLIDEATEAITAALYRVRCGSALGDRDLAAAGTALGDLFGGLGQLAEEFRTTVREHADSSHGHQADRLETLRAMTLSAQREAGGLRLDPTASETIPHQRT